MPREPLKLPPEKSDGAQLQVAPGSHLPMLRPPAAPSQSVGATLAGLLAKRWWLVVSLVLATEGGIVAYTLASPKTYVAYTTLNSGIGTKDPLGGGGDWFTQGTMVANITELIKSRTVLEETIKALDLESRPEDLAKQVTVSRMGQAGLLKLETEGESPTAASDLANTLVREFLRFYSASQSHEARSNRSFFESQVGLAKDRLRDSENRLKQFKGQQVPEMLSDLPARLSSLVAQRDETARNLAASQAGLAVAQREMARLSSDPLLKQKLKNSAGVLTARDRYAELSANLADARALYGPNAEVVRKLSAQVDRAARQVDMAASDASEQNASLNDAMGHLVQLRTEVAMNAARLASLERSITQLRPLAKDASTNMVTYEQLQREVKIAEAQYMDLQTKFGQSNLMAQGASILNMSVVDPAIPPKEPISSKLVLKLILGLVLSFALALFISYLLSLRERKAARAPERGVVLRARFSRRPFGRGTSAGGEPVV